MNKHIIPVLLAGLLSSSALAKVDMATLPARDTTQLTIYNSADLTLARESRELTLQVGINKLQFSWANTLIDPTSLEMMPLAQADKIDVSDLTFPPRINQLGLWNINSTYAGPAPVEISYFTSGISWRAFYMGTLSSDETTMRLQGYVRVTNNSGEDYENAQVRLIVGKVHLLDEIAELARREQPYGQPGPSPMPKPASSRGSMRQVKNVMMAGIALEAADKVMAPPAPKEIIKEGLSEYFLYTIEGTETIPTGWSKRLPSFDAADVPVVNLYKYEEERYGPQVVRFLSFKNDEDHKLGQTPIPGGMLRVYRGLKDGQLSYQGQSDFKYIPVEEDVELNLGPVQDIIVEPKLMAYATSNHNYDRKDRITGWDETTTWRIKVRNTRPVAAKVDIRRNFDAPRWELTKSGDFGEFEKLETQRVKFVVTLQPGEEKTFEYTLTGYFGDRADTKI